MFLLEGNTNDLTISVRFKIYLMTLHDSFTVTFYKYENKQCLFPKEETNKYCCWMIPEYKYYCWKIDVESKVGHRCQPVNGSLGLMLL